MLKIFSVFDVKAATFFTPMFMPNRGLALRSFSDVCANPDSNVSRHPGDYSLFELGEFDSSKGTFVCHPQPVIVITASDVVAQLSLARSPKGGA